MTMDMARVASNELLNCDIYRMRVETPQIAAQAQVGQFVQVKVGQPLDPILRRPLSIHRIDRDAGVIELLYIVVGKGTKLLSQVKPGESLDIIGPLGRGFELVTNKPALLVAGGIGIAPLLPVAEELVKAGTSVKLFYGARQPEALVTAEDFQALGVEVSLITDKDGTVVDLLRQHATGEQADCVIYSCGPNPMLKAVQEFAASLNIECQLSLEEHMACGFGACLGCACRQKDGGYAHVCTDGPVFKGEEIVL